MFFLTPPKILSIPFFIKQRIILHRPVPLDPFPVIILRPEIIPVPIRSHISREIKHRDLRSLVHPVTVIRRRLQIIKQLFKPLFCLWIIFFRSFKYEEAYLTQYSNIREARRAIRSYVHTYNFERCHSAINNQTLASYHYPALLIDHAA